MNGVVFDRSCSMLLYLLFLLLLCNRDLRKTSAYRDVIYRIDKCDSYNSSGVNLTNVARLMENTEIW